MYCSKDCATADWKLEHRVECKSLGSTAVLVSEQLDNALMEAATNSLHSDYFVGLGNQIADELCLAGDEASEALRAKAQAWVDAHDEGPNVRAALPTPSHVCAYLEGWLQDLEDEEAAVFAEPPSHPTFIGLSCIYAKTFIVVEDRVNIHHDGVFARRLFAFLPPSIMIGDKPCMIAHMPDDDDDDHKDVHPCTGATMEDVD